MHNVQVTCVSLHSHNPSDFCKGIIILLVEGKQTDVSSSCNYRCITLITVIIKLFENVLLKLRAQWLDTDNV